MKFYIEENQKRYDELLAEVVEEMFNEKNSQEEMKEILKGFFEEAWALDSLDQAQAIERGIPTFGADIDLSAYSHFKFDTFVS